MCRGKTELTKEEKTVIKKVKSELANEYKEARINEKIAKRKIGILCIVVFFCILCLLAMAYVNYYILTHLPSDLQFADSTYTSTLLTDGLAIIAIAISVWAGLNIANAVERKELDETNEKIKAAEEKIKNEGAKLNQTSTQLRRLRFENTLLHKESEELENKIQPLAESTQSVQKSLSFMFENALLQTVGDEASKYLYQAFLQLDTAQSHKCEKYYPDMVLIEQIFAQQLKIHTSDQLKIEELEAIVNDGIQIIDSILGENLEKAKNIELGLVVTYLKYRKAEFCYYLGYITSDHQKYYNYFTKAAELYLQVYPDFHAFVPQYTSQSEIPEYKRDSKYRDISMYFMNSIGDAYSRFILYAKLSWQITTKSGKLLDTAELIDMGKKAVFYCSCAAKWTNPSEKHEVYYRNLGCAYERLERQEGELGKYYKEIIYNYSKAFESIANDNTHSYRIQSVYSTLIQYLKKYLDNILKINDIFYESSILEKERIDLVELDTEKLEYLKKLYFTTEFAKSDNHRKTLQYCVNGLTFTIIILYKIEKDVTVEEICDLSIEECLKAIKDDILILEMMGANDDYSKELFRRYDLINQYINSKKS